MPVAILLLMIGLIGTAGRGVEQPFTQAEVITAATVMAGAALLASLRRTRSAVLHGIEWLDGASPRRRAAMALGMFVLSALYLPFAGWRADREFVPRVHDEYSYQLMAHQYAAGRLWMPAHPLSDSLDNFYIFTSPVYASMYFPGTGLLHAPAAALGIPHWVVASLVAALCVALLCRVTSEILSPTLGLLASLGLLATPLFQWFALGLMSHLPTLAGILVCYWAYLRWLGTGSLPWVAALAAAAGMTAITRPFDAVILLWPIALAMMIGSFRRGGVRSAGSVLAVATACMLPFLALQLTVNQGITGRLFQTPQGAYFDRFQPNTGLGFQTIVVSEQPQTLVQQKVRFYYNYLARKVREHTPSAVVQPAFWFQRWYSTYFATMPNFWMMAPALLGGVFLIRSQYWPIGAGVLCLFIGYTAFAYYLPWYALPAAGAIWASTAAGYLCVSRFAGSQRKSAEAAIVLALAASSVWSLLWPEAFTLPTPELKWIDKVLHERVQQPAIVFFRFPARPLIVQEEQEPVYNSTAAWPDELSVVRLHSLNPQADTAAIRYYAALEPDRRVYLLDRQTARLYDLGMARELAQRPEQSVLDPAYDKE